MTCPQDTIIIGTCNRGTLPFLPARTDPHRMGFLLCFWMGYRINRRCLSAAIESTYWQTTHFLCDKLVLSFLLFRIFVMKLISSSTVALAVLLAGRVHAVPYKLNDTYEGISFFSGFSFLTQDDPLNGRV